MKSGSRQSGQAMIYGLFVLIGGLAALFFLFNSGQIVREKTKLVNTADAVAYSGGVMNARALNFHAYTNRAMLANTVAVAQLVSLASWIQYVSALGSVGQTALFSSIYKYLLFEPAFQAAPELPGYLRSARLDPDSLASVAKASDRIVHRVLMNAQQAAHIALLPARREVMDQVAAENYRGDGEVVVDPVPIPTSVSRDYLNFVRRHGGDDRTRFAEAAETVAHKDPFVRKRNWDLLALLPGACPTAYALGRPDWLSRRGGTELLNFDEWKAVDTLSEWVWVPKNKTDVFCRGLSETPAAWGSASAADEPAFFDPDSSHYGGSLMANPGSTGLAMLGAGFSSSWGYAGLPSFYDLSPDALKEDDPQLRMSIRVRRRKAEMQVSGARSEILPSANLNAYEVETAGGDEMVAVSTAEVYFRRDGDARDNVHGRTLGKPREVGSLFNPYWQVRLVQSDEGVRNAQAMQGVALP